MYEPPPHGQFASLGTYTAVTIAISALAVALISWAIVHLVKHRSSIHLWLAASSAVGAVVEPIYNTVTFMQFFPAGGGTPPMFSFWGHNSVPWHFPSYVLLHCAMGYPLYSATRRGTLTRAILWKWLALCSTAEVIAEIILINCGMYTYYAPWPFRLFGQFPFHLTIQVSASFIATALIMQRLHAVLRGHQKILLPFVAPGVLLGGLLFSTWPILLTTGLDFPALAINLLGALSMILVLGLFTLVTWLQPDTTPSSSSAA